MDLKKKMKAAQPKSPAKQTPRVTDLKKQIKELQDKFDFGKKELHNLTGYNNKTIKSLMTLEVEKSNL